MSFLHIFHRYQNSPPLSTLSSSLYSPPVRRPSPAIPSMLPHRWLPWQHPTEPPLASSFSSSPSPFSPFSLLFIPLTHSPSLFYRDCQRRSGHHRRRRWATKPAQPVAAISPATFSISLSLFLSSLSLFGSKPITL